MGTARRHYPPEFEAEAVRLARSSGKSLRQVAMDLGVSNETLGVWVREDGERGVATRLGADERAELVELRRRVKVLETERDRHPVLVGIGVGAVHVARVFTDREAYRRNADDPAQDARYREMRALLAADPEWHDGEIVSGPR